MRLPEEKIKEAILHSDPDIRDRATSFFATSHCLDSSIMALVIQAVETYGRHDAYRLIGLSRDLPQTEESIDWIIDELNDDNSDQFENYTYNLSMVLVEADPVLLLTKESAVLESRHFLPLLHAAFTERLQMLSWNAATCWQKLQEFCEDAKDKQYVNEINLDHANRIVEALARYGEECKEKVLAVLAQKVDDYRRSPMKWMEPLMVRLAGQAQIESAIPVLIAKLGEDGGDILNEQCAAALTRIGTPSVLEAIADVFPNSETHFRIYASGPLENIHSDLAVEKGLHLLRQEKNLRIREILASALLSQFAHEGIEPSRKLLMGRKLDFDSRGLRNYLLETCIIMNEKFPEFDEWLAAEKAEKEEHRIRIEELEGDPNGLLLFALEKLVGEKTPDAPKVERPVLPVPHLNHPDKSARKQKVGRNDLCPCGSGKKFKNCCIGKQNEY